MYFFGSKLRYRTTKLSFQKKTPPCISFYWQWGTHPEKRSDYYLKKFPSCKWMLWLRPIGQIHILNYMVSSNKDSLPRDLYVLTFDRIFVKSTIEIREGKKEISVSRLLDLSFPRFNQRNQFWGKLPLKEMTMRLLHLLLFLFFLFKVFKIFKRLALKNAFILNSLLSNLSTGITKSQ